MVDSNIDNIIGWFGRGTNVISIF